jgi:hypothetical protein
LNPYWGACEILFFQAEAFCPESEVKTYKVVKIWLVFKFFVFVFQVMEDSSEEAFGVELKVIISFGFHQVLIHLTRFF